MQSTYTYKPDQYSSHSKIIKLIKPIKRPLKILDIGCAQGYIAKKLSHLGHEVTGIESDKQAAALAKEYCKKIHICNLDNKIPKLKKEYFDILIFGDIIEHLKAPEQVLHHLLKSLKPKGLVIISVPNIANIYIRLNLLLGRFNYTKKGILDRTHLHFYTLKTIKKFIRKLDLRIIKTDKTPIPLPLVFPSTAKGKLFNFIHQINYLFTKIWKKLFAFQFIILAKKNE